jgi:hypothetical protein
MNYATFQRFIVALPDGWYLAHDVNGRVVRTTYKHRATHYASKPEALAAVCRVHASRYDIVSIETIESV